MNTTHPQTFLEAVRDLAPQIEARVAQVEIDRRLPAELAQTMAELGIFRLMIPSSLGGLEMDLIPALHVFEEISQIDGSTGWCAMIGASVGSAFSAAATSCRIVSLKAASATEPWSANA